VTVEGVAGCALRLDEVGGDVRCAADRAAVAVPSDWLGSAGARYSHALSKTVADVRRTADAYGAAGAVLLPYARALADAHAVQEQAARLRDQASAEAAVALLTGRPDEGVHLRLAADRLEQEAVEAERRAAAECAAALHELAVRAPAARRSTGAWRVASDVAAGVGATVRGMGSLVASGAHALPFLNGCRAQRDARHELASQAVAMMRVWETPVQMWHDLLDGRPGLALASAAFIGRTPKGLIRDRHAAHREALREESRQRLVARTATVRPSVWEMGLDGVSLASEEARGGHVLREHVGATREYLLARNREKRPIASTFADGGAAERWVNEVLRRRADEIADVYSLPEGDLLELEWTFPEVVGWGTVRRSGRSVTAHTVRVLIGIEGGAPHVVTAYPSIDVPR
jgi:hypothetical protein